MAGHVYLIGSHLYSWFKIGRSKTPKVRITDIGILLPFKVEVVAIWQAENYVYLESLLHRKYRLNHINGEWFHFNKMELEALIFDVPYPMVQYQALTDFVNMEKDYVREPFKMPQTREEHEWRKQHRDAWKKVREIESKEDRKKAAQKLIADRKLHRIHVIQKKHSA